VVIWIHQLEIFTEGKITGGRTGPADLATSKPMFTLWCLKV